MIEHEYNCPYCTTLVSTLVDPSIEEQSYVEDCELCCNPIEFFVKLNGGKVIEFNCKPEGY